MSQQLSFSQLVANRGLAQFKFETPYTMTADRSYQMDFENKTYDSGESVQVRRPNLFIGQRGNVLPPQAIVESTTFISVGLPYGLNIAVDSTEAALEMTKNDELYAQRYTDPIIKALASSLEVDIANAGLTQVNYFAGSPNSSFSDFSLIDAVDAQMAVLNMPTNDDVSMVLQSYDLSALKSSNQNAFNNTLNDDISFYSRLGRYSRFNMYRSSYALRHVCGSGAGTPLVNGAVTSGFTINMDGFTASSPNVIRKGDIIQIGNLADASGVQSVQPRTRSATGQLMTFTASEDYNSNGAGQVVFQIAAPDLGIISDPTNPRVNVSQALPDNAAVTIVGAGSSYNVAYAYTSRGLALVMPKMMRNSSPYCALAEDSKSKISLRITKAWDQQNGLDSTRVDFLAGFKFFDQYCIKIISKPTVFP